MVTVFDGGRRRALDQQAQAAYDQTVATYRQTVLAAFAEVEDNLAALRVLEEEAKLQDAAVASAERSLTLSTNRYKGGVVDVPGGADRAEHRAGGPANSNRHIAAAAVGNGVASEGGRGRLGWAGKARRLVTAAIWKRDCISCQR